MALAVHSSLGRWIRHCSFPSRSQRSSNWKKSISTERSIASSTASPVGGSMVGSDGSSKLLLAGLVVSDTFSRPTSHHSRRRSLATIQFVHHGIEKQPNRYQR